jgi:hypothetical protein
MRDEGAVAILHATVYGIAYASHDESKVKFSYQLFEEGQTAVSSISIDQVNISMFFLRFFPFPYISRTNSDF